MSTQTPNLGYTPPPFNRPTPRSQRRIAKDQARLQRRALQRRSIAGPILLITIGVLLLLLQSGRLHWASVFTWLSMWWPAILIGTGILMILEWILDRQLSARAGALAPRRILGGAATGVLLLMAAAGAGLTITHSNASFFRDALHAPWIGNGRNDGSPFFGVHSDFTSDLKAPLATDGRLTVENPHGDVTVIGSSPDGQLHVSVHQRLFTEGDEDVNARHLRELPKFRGDSAHLTLATTLDGEDDADLTVQLPHNASLVIRSGQGDVSVEEVHGATDITATNGDVKLTALRGPVHVETADDDSTITAHSLGGGLTLNGHTGDMDLSDIDNGLTLHGDFFGTTQLQRIRGNVNFQSSFTQFTCEGIPGDLTVEGRSDFTAKYVQGPIVLATTDRDIHLDGVRGAASITNRNGSVTLTLTAPLQPLHIINTNGTVNLSIPDHQPFTLHAMGQDAQIRNDFNLPVTTQGSTAVVAGKVLGGGPELVIETTNDDIEIHKVSSTTTGNWTDASRSDITTPERDKQTVHRVSISRGRL